MKHNGTKPFCSQHHAVAKPEPVEKIIRGKKYPRALHLTQHNRHSAVMRVVFLVTCFWLSGVTSASTWLPGWMPQTYPTPSTFVGSVACGHGDGRPALTCDPDGLFRDLFAVEQAVRALEAESRQACGPNNDVLGTQFAVAVMRKMSPPPLSAETFATALHNMWGVGHAECGNGILLLVSLEDRRIYLSTGRDAKRHIPDARVQQIVDGMKPFLRSENVQGAVLSAVARCVRCLVEARYRGCLFVRLSENSLSVCFILCLQRRRNSRPKSTHISSPPPPPSVDSFIAWAGSCRCFFPRRYFCYCGGRHRLAQHRRI